MASLDRNRALLASLVFPAVERRRGEAARSCCRSGEPAADRARSLEEVPTAALYRDLTSSIPLILAAKGGPCCFLIEPVQAGAAVPSRRNAFSGEPLPTSKPQRSLLIEDLQRRARRLEEAQLRLGGVTVVKLPVGVSSPAGLVVVGATGGSLCPAGI